MSKNNHKFNSIHVWLEELDCLDDDNDPYSEVEYSELGNATENALTNGGILMNNAIKESKFVFGWVSPQDKDEIDVEIQFLGGYITNNFKNVMCMKEESNKSNDIVQGICLSQKGNKIEMHHVGINEYHRYFNSI